MRRIVLVSVVPALLLVTMGMLLVRSRDVSRDLLAERFAARIDAGVDFIAGFVRDRQDEEERIARERFSGRTVDHSDFVLSSTALGFEAAVLLNDRGELLAVHPRRDEILGDRIGSGYAHLSAALAGKRAVSGVVPSAARGFPVIGMAVPYETAHGRRVFSGAFSIEVGPLGRFLQEMLPFQSAVAFLIDDQGVIAATSRPPRTGISRLAEVDPGLGSAVAPGGVVGARQGRVSTDIGHVRFLSERVPGTTWTLAARVTEEELFGPLTGSDRPQWAVFILLAMVAALAVYLVHRLSNTATEVGERLKEQTRLNRALEDFSGRAAHDLRSPLGGIRMAVDLIGNPKVDEARRVSLVQALSNQTDKAISLIDDLLDLARAAGTARRERVDVRDLVAQVADEAEGVEIEIGPLPRSAEIDPLSMRQALLNLLRNAARYATDNGRAQVALSAVRDGSRIVFEVADRGPGVPPERRDRLFEPFVRGSGETQPGTGLGLAIVGATAEAHGGRAWYEDRPGGGAVFKVEVVDTGRVEPEA